MNLTFVYTMAEMTFREKLIDATTMTVVGMGIVFLSLALMGEIFVLLKRLMTRDGFKTEPVAAPKVVSPVAPEPSGVVDASGSSDVDPKLLAILTAAAFAVVRKPLAVRRITFINRNTISGWTEAGRTDIHSSHAPRSR
jgi:Na+-transporting methylmalonyl-CoA/oxaloacetate decarboxylase gamma subunit